MNYKHIGHAALALLLGVATLCSCGKKSPSSDSTSQNRSIEYIRKISITQPQQALAMIDSAEQTHSLSPLDVNMLRAVVQNNAYSNASSALHYAMKAAADSTLTQQPKKHLQVTSMLAYLYFQSGIYNRCLGAVDKGLQLARSQGLAHEECLLMLTKGMCESEVGMTDRSISTFNTAINKMYRHSRVDMSWQNMKDLVDLFAQKCIVLMENDRYADVVADYDGYLHAIDEFGRAKPETVAGTAERARTVFYATYALSFEKTGDKKQGYDMFEKLQHTARAKETKGYTFLIPYLIAEQRYGEALQKITALEKYYAAMHRDSAEYYIVNEMLPFKVQALYGEGRYKESAEAGMRTIALKDTLDRRLKAQKALWMNEVLSTKEKDLRISEQQESLHTSYMLIIITTAIIIVLIVLFVRVLVFNRIIRQKNVVATKNINDLLTYKEQLAYLLRERNEAEAGQGSTPSAPAVPADDSEDEGRALFVAIEQHILGERLFVNPKLSRDDIITMFGVPRNRFSKIFNRFTGKTFNKYVNDLRLDYAALLLKTNPNYSVEAIAAECGIPVRQTFYRLFCEKFGITPAEFRKINNDINDEEKSGESEGK